MHRRGRVILYPNSPLGGDKSRCQSVPSALLECQSVRLRETPSEEGKSNPGNANCKQQASRDTSWRPWRWRRATEKDPGAWLGGIQHGEQKHSELLTSPTTCGLPTPDRVRVSPLPLPVLAESPA